MMRSTEEEAQQQVRPNDVLENGFRDFFPKFGLTLRKKPQKGHLVRFCGVFAVPQLAAFFSGNFCYFEAPCATPFMSKKLKKHQNQFFARLPLFREIAQSKIP